MSFSVTSPKITATSSVPVTTVAQAGMFHTFQGVTVRKPPSGSKLPQKPPAKTTVKRITTPHACAECKRRKIRCDGKQPCGQCLSGRSQKKCFYDKHRQRVIPSRRALESLSQAVNEHRAILKLLYPHHEVQDLSKLSRDELIQLIHSTHAITQSNASSCSDVLRDEEVPPSNSTDSIKSESPTGLSFDPFELKSHTVEPPQTPPHHRLEPSLAVLSIKESISIMAKVRPTVRDLLSVCPGYLESLSVYPTIDQIQKMDTLGDKGIWCWNGQSLVDAYFRCAHELMPMIDEAEFRAYYRDGLRNDHSWLCLLNIVLAVGCLFVSDTEDSFHLTFYARAMSHLDAYTTNTESLEMIHVLAIAGGFYLPYINKPAMAGSFLGAAIRMARSLSVDVDDPLPTDGAPPLSADIRRRTWLSLLSLNSWISTSPSHSEYYSPEILPELLLAELGENKPTDQSNTESLVLIENIRLSHIASRIYSFLGRQGPSTLLDYQHLDNQLSNWFNQSPLMAVVVEHGPESLWTASRLLKWRYCSLRILLYRKRLFELAAEGTLDLTQEDILIVEQCRTAAREVIQDLIQQQFQGQYLARMAACLLYDTVMVPLVSLFWQQGSPRSHQWSAEVSSVIPCLDALQEWSTVARDGCDIVERLYAIGQDIRQSIDSLSTSVTGSLTGYSPISPDDGNMIIQAASTSGFTVAPTSLLYHDGSWSSDVPLWVDQPNAERQSIDIAGEVLPISSYAETQNPATSMMVDVPDFKSALI